MFRRALLYQRIASINRHWCFSSLRPVVVVMLRRISMSVPQSSSPKLYTGTGDKGTSGLFTGERRRKSDAVFEAMGAVDELSCHLGLVIDLCEESQLSQLIPKLVEVQCILQDVCSVVATPMSSARDAHTKRTGFPQDVVGDIEKLIDSYSDAVGPLKNFILPSGGGSVAAMLQLSRAVCRRAERRLVIVNESDSVDEHVLKYMNRLSDLLFVLGRYAAKVNGKEERIYRRVERHVMVKPTAQTRHYSTVSSPETPVCLDRIFSEENKRRSQAKLGDNVAPLRRKFTTNKPTEAAVLVPLCYCAQVPSILFTKRSRQVPKHRGEVSFPGGMAAKHDVDLMDTALRETEEELGLCRDKVDVWGSMHPLPNKDGKLAVTPVVGFLGHVDVDMLVPCDKEVESVFSVPIKTLCDPRFVGTTQFRRRHDGWTLPVFRPDNTHRIWGMTAVILHFVMSILAPDHYRLKVEHVTPKKLGLTD